MNQSDVIVRLRAELEQVQRLAEANFTGLGVIVWDGASQLPVLPLNSTQPNKSVSALSTTLANLGCSTSPYHDGFHVLTADFKIFEVAMYFSPPIISGVRLDRNRGHGGRYVAGILGSLVPGVLATGVLSTNYGVVVFADGQEIQR